MTVLYFKYSCIVTVIYLKDIPQDDIGLPGDSYVVPCWVVDSYHQEENRSEPKRNYIRVSRYVLG